MKAPRVLLVALATLRLTRFVTTDWLGEWTVVGPIKRWAVRDTVARAVEEDWFRTDFEAARLRALEEHSTEDADRVLAYGVQGPHPSHRARLAKGLDCPFCVGFWIGALLLLGEVATRRWRALRGPWTLLLGALGLNYAVAHVSSRLDD